MKRHSMSGAMRAMSDIDTKSPEQTATPVASPVKADPRALLELARDRSEDGRQRLTRAVGELLEGGLETGAVEMATDLLLELLERAELDLREALAEQFAIMEEAPLRLVLALSHDSINVAKPVLINSPVLTDVDLEYIIRASTAEYWQVIAMRKQISEKVVDCLVNTGDVQTALNVLNNETAALSDKSIRRLSNQARTDEVLQDPLLQRDEMTRDIASELYWFASREIRNFIVGKYEIDPNKLDDMLESIVTDFVDSATGTISVTQEMENLARQFTMRGQLTPHHLIQTLRRGQMSFFVAMLAEFAGIATSLARRLIQTDAYRTFALMCRALNVSKQDFATIFLLSRGGRADEKVVHPEELARAMRIYERYDANTARENMIRLGIRLNPPQPDPSKAQ